MKKITTVLSALILFVAASLKSYADSAAPPFDAFQEAKEVLATFLWPTVVIVSIGIIILFIIIYKRHKEGGKKK